MSGGQVAETTNRHREENEADVQKERPKAENADLSGPALSAFLRPVSGKAWKD